MLFLVISSGKYADFSQQNIINIVSLYFFKHTTETLMSNKSAKILKMFLKSSFILCQNFFFYYCLLIGKYVNRANSKVTYSNYFHIILRKLLIDYTLTKTK